MFVKSESNAELEVLLKLYISSFPNQIEHNNFLGEMLKQKSEPQPITAEPEPAELRAKKLSLVILLSSQVCKLPS